MKIAAEITDQQRVDVQYNTITLSELRKLISTPSERCVCDIAEDSEEEEEEEEDRAP